MKTKREHLEAFLTSIREQNAVNGAFLIADQGEVLLKQTIGLADFRNGRMLTVDSVFELASLSKPITALGIVLLWQSGKVELDDLVTAWISNFPYSDITIRHLLGHTSGLPDYMELFSEHWDRSIIATNQDVLNMLIRYKPELLFPSNTGWMYSNTGYVILALLIERISGQTFAGFLKDQLFVPLGMNQTRVYNRRSEEEEIPDYAYGFVYSFDEAAFVLPDTLKELDYVRYLDGIQGDGTVNSTLNDLLKLDQALYRDDFLDVSLREELFIPVLMNSDQPFEYGLGWIIERKEGIGRVVSHNGGWPGYATIMKRYIDQDMTLIVLLNTEKDLQYNQQVVDAMEHILCGEDYEIPLPSAERIIAEVDSSVYKRYAGRYRFNNELAGQVIFADVVVEDDRLYMRLNNGMPLAMYPLNDTRFFFREDLAEVEFVGEENGRVQYLYFGSNDEMERADRET